MSLQPLHVAREGLELGVLTTAESRELLRAGFLRPTDECWTDAEPQRRRLSTVADIQPGGAGGWLQWTRVAVSNAGGTVRGQAGKLTKSITVAAQQQKAVVARSTKVLLEDFAPRVRELASSQLKGRFVGTAKSALNDESFLKKLFGAIYDCLPKPVRRFISEETFVTFCLERRRQLLD